ncbi:MAG: acyl-CoA synthetase FdrA [Anaerolineales bacterium]|nr:acyl-CoA synthetase FdrA [Anaerolineales bacterium]
MAAICTQIRRGAYYDSVILMQLQRSLLDLPGVLDAGVVMGTRANMDVLRQSGLLALEIEGAATDDLVIVVKAESDAAGQAALEQIDELIAGRRRGDTGQEFRPKSLESAAGMAPEARWVLVSVAGRYAAGVARDALNLGKNVFLYSDNVPLKEEIVLKQLAAERGLLVMGPDCGTAIINGVGLGFANSVRRGPVGVVAASGTGMQQVTARIHQLGSGITHAIGAGGRDLSQAVNGATTRQGLDLLARDPDTRVILLVSKPPSPGVAQELLAIARMSKKPVVVDFIGFTGRSVENVHFVTTFDQAAEMAVQLAMEEPETEPKGLDVLPDLNGFADGQRYLRGLFSGGTLAYEVQLLLQDYVQEVYSNAPLDKRHKLENPMFSREHTIVDLGGDEFTVGRLHPMMDNDLRIRRLAQEADDRETVLILMDVVLGYGAHQNPAAELAPAIIRARNNAEKNGRRLEVVIVMVGTDQDPQNLEDQVLQLVQAGARVETSNDRAVRYVGRLLREINGRKETGETMGVELAVLKQPLSAINVGLESFTESLITQKAPVIQVDWRPPAGGNQKLMSILDRMKG